MNTFTQTVADPEPFSPAEAFQELMRVLRLSLPAPDKDTPAAWALRDRVAIRAVRALLPENAAEGRMAAQVVAADSWASDCMRLAEENWREPTIAKQCRAQAMGMMREAKSATRTLLQMQAARKAIEADPVAAQRAEWIEHGVGRMMAAGLAPDADEPVAGDAAGDRATEGQDEDTHEAVSGVGPVSNFAKNPQDISSETKTGLGEGMPGAATDEEREARGAAPHSSHLGPR